MKAVGNIGHDLADQTTAALVREVQGVSIKHAKRLNPTPGTLTADVLWAGVCGTDLQILRGERQEDAKVLGHEGLVRIVSLPGGLREELREGWTAMLNPTLRWRQDILLGHTIDGLMQSRITLPNAYLERGSIRPASVELDGPLSTLVEPLATVLTAFRICPPGRGPIGVFGMGIVGHLIALYLRRQYPKSRRRLIYHSMEAAAASPIAEDAQTQKLCWAELEEQVHRLGNISVAYVTTQRRCVPNVMEAIPSVLEDNGQIHLVAGWPSEKSWSLAPGLDIAALRTAHTAEWPDNPQIASVQVRDRDDGGDARSLRLSGHRGVPMVAMIEAEAELLARSDIYRTIVTHVLSPADAAASLTDYARTGYRRIFGEPFLKIAIDFQSLAAATKEGVK